MQINNIFPKRDKTISIVKAIGIILMVVGHSGCPKWLHDYIYMFHMPLFFFCSGYFFKPVAQLSQLKDFIIKRIKKLYFPFVKWSLFFLLLHNILFKMNIYNDKYGFSGNVSSVYGVEDFMSRFLNIVFAMRGNEQLLGGFWFIRVLFISSIVLSVICCFKIEFISNN